MSKSNINVNLGILPLLGTVFIVLKLCNVIDWAWLWVLCPLWAPVVFILGFIFVYILVGLLLALIKK